MKIKQIAVLCLLAVIACSPKNPKDPGYVVASFNGGKIVRADLTKKASLIVKRFGSRIEDLNPTQASMLEWQVLNEMVNEKIILKKVDPVFAKEIKPKVDQQIDALKKRFPDETQFKANLTQSGISEEDLRYDIARRVALEYLVAKENPTVPPVDDAEVKKFYEQNPQYWNQDERLHMRYILITIPKNAAEDVKNQKKAAAEAARKRVTGGEDFGKVAASISDEKASGSRGGELPEMSPSQLPPEFQKAVLTLKPGGISPVFQSADGYHIVQVVQRIAARVVPFAEVKDKIANSLQSRRRVDEARKLIEKYRQDAKVEIRIPNPSSSLGQGPAGPALTPPPPPVKK